MNGKSEEVHVPEVRGQSVDEFGKIEIYGIDIISEADRHGTAKELFWPWFSANSTFINMIVGGVLILYGLNIWEALSAVVWGTWCSSSWASAAFPVPARGPRRSPSVAPRLAYAGISSPRCSAGSPRWGGRRSTSSWERSR